MTAARWLIMAFALAAGVVGRMLRPLSWRRSMRGEFWRFMELVCRRNIAPVTVAAVFVGAGLLGQGLYWLDQFGQAETIGEVVKIVVVREIGPFVAGLLVLATGGILILGELGAMRAGGQLDALDRQGLDPFELLFVPRVAALIVAVFVHSIAFAVISLLTGYTAAQVLGVIEVPPVRFLGIVLDGIGAYGYFLIPAKAVAIGLTIGAICGLTAMDRRAGAITDDALTARGMVRATSGILLVSALLSLTF